MQSIGLNTSVPLFENVIHSLLCFFRNVYMSCTYCKLVRFTNCIVHIVNF